MTGFMFKVVDRSDAFRWFIVAVEDQAGAEAALRERTSIDGDLECKPLPASVIEFLGMSPGDVQRWMPA